MTRFIVTVDGKRVGPLFGTFGQAMPLFLEHNGGDPFPKRTGPKVKIERVDVKKGDK